jgi:hypothetical protein
MGRELTEELRIKICVVTVPEDHEEDLKKPRSKRPLTRRFSFCCPISALTWSLICESPGMPASEIAMPPLPKICRFIPYSELKKEVEPIGRRMRYMKT